LTDIFDFLCEIVQSYAVDQHKSLLGVELILEAMANDPGLPFMSTLRTGLILRNSARALLFNASNSFAITWERFSAILEGCSRPYMADTASSFTSHVHLKWFP
jgi:hypothetical protein